MEKRVILGDKRKGRERELAKANEIESEGKTKTHSATGQICRVKERKEKRSQRFARERVRAELRRADLIRPSFLAEPSGRDTAWRLNVRRQLDGVVGLKESNEEEGSGVVGELLTNALEKSEGKSELLMISGGNDEREERKRKGKDERFEDQR